MKVVILAVGVLNLAVLVGIIVFLAHIKKYLFEALYTRFCALHNTVISTRLELQDKVSPHIPIIVDKLNAIEAKTDSLSTKTDSSSPLV